MSVLTGFTLLLLCLTKVRCGQGSPSCPQKETVPGVLILKVGSEVILGCRGNITVDGVPLVMVTKHKESLKRRDVRESPGTIGIYQETENVSTTNNLKIKTETGIYAESVTTAKPAKSSGKEQMGSGHVLQAVNQSTKPNSATEGEAFSMTTEMGLSTEKTTNTEYKDDDDYDENMGGSRVTRSIRRQARWAWNGQKIRKGVENGGVLKLPALELGDSGNYSCYRRGKIVSSVKIFVGIPPEIPTLSCYKKSHTSKIRCEWVSKQPIVPPPQCYLDVRKVLQMPFRVNCSYSVQRSRCWCTIPSDGIDRNSYSATLCVTNVVGHATSYPYNYIPQNIIKPDPPARLVVKPIMGEPKTLKVTWSLPATWKQSKYYTLHFQLRYRPVYAKEYQKAYIDDTDYWLISDALPHVQYELQIQAKDEYDGQWSDWTSPVYAHTWRAPETTVAPDLATQGAFWVFPEGSGGSEEEVEIRPAGDGYAAMWVYVLWVVGVCLFLTIIILSVYSFRRRMPLMSKKSKESVSSACSCSSPSPLLQQPLMTQTSNHQEAEGGGIHLHNVDYFFSSM